MKFLQEIEVRNLICFAFGMILTETVLVLSSFYRLNTLIGVSDFNFFMIIYIFGKANLISLVILPMSAMMMQVIPKSIEASMFAVVSAALSISIDWGGDIMGAIVCSFFNITS